MRDGPVRAAIKAVVRLAWAVELRLRRRVSPPPFTLAGACGGCARCCEEPAIAVGWVTRRIPTVRRLFLAWQRHVNGFELTRMSPRALHFRCTHLDPVTRRCDSYPTRPFLCRDYPRALLDGPAPDLFPECGFRPVARNAAALARAIEAQDLPPEKKAAIRRTLHLE